LSDSSQEPITYPDVILEEHDMSDGDKDL